MPQVTADDVGRMTDAVYLDGSLTGRKATRFWGLLLLAAVIATAGLVADSAATVIGAMIVAPLMTPILGTALAVVLADRAMVLRSVAYVLAGAALVVVLGFAVGLLVHDPAGLAGNAQVDGRISPRLIDLLGALATGTVGAFALARPDISDTLPGVAIAISLVPPLAVVGLLLEVHRYSDAWGALLLFLTNVAAIVATGVAVLLAYRVRGAALASGHPVGALRGTTLAVVVGLVVLVAVPLAAGSVRVALDRGDEVRARTVVDGWAQRTGWDTSSLQVRDRTLRLSVIGPTADPPLDSLRDELRAADVDLPLRVEVVVGTTRTLGG